MAYKKKKLFILIYLLLSNLVYSDSFAQLPIKKNISASDSANLPLDPAVKTGKLANGLTYFIRKNQYPEKRVIFYLVTKAGSILETENQRGLAHFLEHMNFNGTSHFPKNELINYLEKSGIKFGADLNAYTAFDETVYQLPLPSDDQELLNNGIQIIRDWAHGATLDPVEIDKERGVILEEKRSRMGIQERTMEKTFPVILNNSLYASRLPIGTENVIENFKNVEIKAFYDQWYRPDLQAVIVVGDIDPLVMEKKIKTLFSNLKNPKNVKERMRYSIPLSGKQQFLSFTDPEAQFMQIELMNKFRGKAVSTKDDYRNRTIRSLFNQMLGLRFSQLQQKSNPPFISANAGASNYLADLDVFSFSVKLKPGLIEAGFKQTYAEIIRIKKDGFTQSELDYSKKAIYAALENMMKNKNKIPSTNYVEEYLAYFTRNEAAPGIDAEYMLSKKFLNDINLNDINKAALSMINLPDQDIVVSGPDKDKAALPDEQQLLKWISQLSLQKTVAYSNVELSNNLIDNIPKAGQVTSSKSIPETGTTEHILSNGVKIILKPTEFKNDEILFSAFKAGGTSLSTDQDYLSAANAANIMTAGGVGNHNKDGLKRMLNGKNLSVAPYINELYQGVSGSSGIEDLETAFQLINLYFTQPRKDTTIFRNMMSNAKLSLANRSNNADAVFADSISSVLGNFSIRRQMPDTAAVGKLSIEKAYSFYKDCFGNANGFTFIFTGSFKPDEILKFCAQYLGSLPSDVSQEKSFRDLDINIPKGVYEYLVYKGDNPRATVKLVLSGNYNFTQANNLNLLALSEIIGFRLTERLRETEGGVYTPQVNVAFGKYPKSTYAFNIDFVCSPNNAQKLAVAALEEINHLATKGISELDLQKFKAEKIREFEVERLTNAYWLGYLNNKLSEGEDLKEINSYISEINSISTLSLQQQVKKYLNGDNLIKFILYPENFKAK